MSFKKFKRLKEDKNSQISIETHMIVATSYNLLFNNIKEHSFYVKEHKSGMEDKLWIAF